MNAIFVKLFLNLLHLDRGRLLRREKRESLSAQTPNLDVIGTYEHLRDGGGEGVAPLTLTEHLKYALQ